MSHDPRLHLVRGPTAGASLEGVIEAATYRSPRPTTAVAPSAPIRREPDGGSEQVDQLVFGEGFQVLEIHEGWAFGQATRDGYVGWAPTEALAAGAPRPTHWVRAIRTYAFAHPSFRASAWGPLPMNALVRLEGREGGYARVVGAGWVAEAHLSPLGLYARDPAAVAEGWLGAAYLWGGRDGLGLDCSGVVQQALYACGRACPRDSDQQLSLGEPLTVGEDLAGLQRNDLVFWDGHVGLMLDGERLLHANATHMAVVAERLADAVARKRAAGEGGPIGYRRLR